MKHIVLAKKSKRMLSRLIDFILVTGAAFILFFSAVFPNYFDSAKYKENSDTIIELYKDSQLYVVSSKGQYAAKCTYGANSLSETYDRSLTIDGQTFDHNNFWKDLYIYYTQKATNYGEQMLLTLETFETNILKVGSSESNILHFDVTLYKPILIDENRTVTTLSFFLKAYEGAATIVNDCQQIKTPVDNNRKALISTVAMIIPCIVAMSLVFDLIIPLCMPYGQTIGKVLFKLQVINKDGYKLKRIWYLPRWLIYVGVEYILGVMTFGGVFLISYTMFLFTKKNRCLHDYLSNSCVIDKEQSIFFDTPLEEYYYKMNKEGKYNV